jgi:hypothetical protein
MGKTSRWRTSNLFYLACIFSILVALINLAIVLLVNDQQQRGILSDVISPIVDISTCAILIVAAKRSSTLSKRLGLAWGTIALALIFFALGDATWAILEIGRASCRERV